MTSLDPPEKLRELRERIDILASADPQFRLSDSDLRRFLRGRKGSVDDAFVALVEYVQWRRDTGVDSITAESCEREVNSGKATVTACGVHGKPTITVLAAKHDKDKRDVAEMTRFIILTLETACRCLQPPDETVVIVFDLLRFSLQCMDYKVVKRLVYILGHFYPERLQMCYIVHAPVVFDACWAVIRPWIDPVTVAKVQFVDEAQLAALLQPADGQNTGDGGGDGGGGGGAAAVECEL